MSGVSSVATACLLLIASFGQHAYAARPREQRRGVTEAYPILPPGLPTEYEEPQLSRDLGEKVFTLRHIYHHGSHEYPNLHRYIDIPKNAELWTTEDDGESKEVAPEKLSARGMSINVQRMADRRKQTIDDLLDHAAIHGSAMSLPSSAWTVDEISGPNTTDKQTVLTFARMAANAYVTEPWTGDWEDVKGGFNYTEDFGWEADGLRGHIFADETNGTVIVGLKGTSMAVFDGIDTTGNDKTNDNLFGSCCCGQGGQYLWKQVCDCMTSTYTCNSTCLVKSLQEKSHYYFAARDLYHNVTERYPHADIWMSGHSLGGVVSTLLGLTYGFPVFTFEAFPDALAASRLGLPTPPGYRIGSHQSRPDVAIHHYGHTADPVFMGTCNTASALCTIAGYAFQGVCHTGKTCIYDTVSDLGWRVGVGTHRITSVIKDVIKKYDHVPTCEEDTECQDCFNWKFYESNGTERTTTSSSSSTSTSRTRSRTETCQTPGWWGCLDKTTTTESTTSTSSSTSTCETPGWFGCNDPTTTTSTSSKTTSTAAPAPTITTTSELPSSTSTRSCETPGWFGCDDATPSPTPTTAPSTSSHTSLDTVSTTSSAEVSCTSKAWFGLICLDPSPDLTDGAVKTEPPGRKQYL